MTNRQRYRKRADNGFSTEERQARVLTFQILAVTVIVLACWALKSTGGDLYERLRVCGNVILTGGESGELTFSYEKLEAFLSGGFSLPKPIAALEDALARLGIQSETKPPPAEESLARAAGAAGGGAHLTISKAAALADEGPARPKTASFSPLIVSAPFNAPVTGTVTSKYGWRENPFDEMEADFHTGLDIAAPEGSGIFAALPGEVSETGQSSAFGNYIYLSHGDGLYSFYAHCSEIIARQGERLRQGERIALVGSTGNSTGPHLHFEIKKDGLSYSPETLLPLVYREERA